MRISHEFTMQIGHEFSMRIYTNIKIEKSLYLHTFAFQTYHYSHC